MVQILIYGFGAIMAAQLLGTAIGLQCYECTGPKGQKHDCDLNLPNVNVMNCTPGLMCTLYINTINGNQSSIHRLCTQSNECDVLRSSSSNTHLMGQNATIDVCYSCNSSLCNKSAESFLVSSKIPFLFLCLFVTTFLSFGYNKMLI